MLVLGERVRRRFKGQLVTGRELEPVDVEERERIEKEWLLMSFLGALGGFKVPNPPEWLAYKLEQDQKRAQEEEEQKAQQFEREGGYRPTRDGTLPREGSGLGRLVNTFWGAELLDMSLIFVVGRQGFADIIPSDLTKEFLVEHCSIADEDALYVMVVSSLHWALENDEISDDEARLKALDIAWIFHLSPEDPRRRSWLQGEFQKTVNAYHGKYQWFEPKGYDGEITTKLVRKILHKKKVDVPERITRWIETPNNLLEDFAIESKLPYSWHGEPNRNDFLRLLPR